MEISRPIVYLVATAHLDTVWNWDLEQTVKEFLPRTLEQNFSLLEKYPEYRFNFEGGYRYQLIKDYYPEQYERLKQYIRQGRWCPAGSAWENGDVILPSPEALMRNFLYGNKFFKQEFGRMTTDVFLPDCFGFSHALPSIAAHMGLRSFSSAKLIWNADNYRPFDFGRWYGPDGSFLFACLNPQPYISDVEEDYENSEGLMNLLAALPVPKYMRYYGVGDMGGAPNEESVRHVCNGVRNESGKIRLVSGSPGQMADELTDEEIERLPQYDGELVMKTHATGAYTSRGILKRLNRKNEIIADQAERFSLLADWFGVKPYPAGRLETAWKRLLCHQFHDDITGTSTDKVYGNTINEYFVSLNEFSGELSAACEAIGEHLATDCGIEGTPVILFNSCCFPRREVVEATVSGLALEKGGFCVLDDRQNEVPSQLSEGTQDGCQTVLLTADIPAMGYRTYYIVKNRPPRVPEDGVHVSESHLENQRYRVELNAERNISRIYDKAAGEELLARPICLEILQNTYTHYGAWEILYADICSCPDVLDKADASAEIVEAGPLRSVLKITRRHKNSAFAQCLTLDYGSDRLNIEYTIDWHEPSSLLKLRFTANEKYATARYDGGIGVETERNNHEKKYEFAASRWVAMQPEAGGRSLLLMSDCKYGWDKPTDNVVRLSAIHTPYNKWSDSARQDLQDFGENRFGVAVCAADTGDFYRISESYNVPVVAVQAAVHGGGLPREWSFMRCSSPSVAVRCIKQAEESDDCIVRIYNTMGADGQCDLLVPEGLEAAYEADGNETRQRGLAMDGGRLPLSLRPFETKTIGLRLGERTFHIKAASDHPVRLPFNTVASSPNDRAGDYGFGDAKKTLPTEKLGGRIECCGLSFALERDGSGDVLATVCEGQELELPADAKAFYLIGGCLESDKNTYFTVNGAPYKLPMQSIFEPIGRWDQYALMQKGRVKTDRLAFYASHTHGAKGDAVLEKGCLFLYEIKPPEGIRSLRLPFDRDILLLSAIARNGSTISARVNHVLYDTK